MAKKKKKQAPAKSSQKFSSNPFKSLKQLELPPEETQPTDNTDVKEEETAPWESDEDLDENELFLRSVAGATLNKERPTPKEPSPSIPPQVDEEAEAQLELIRLVNGELPFDISDSDEYIEGCVHGLPKGVLKRLKQGEYSIQARLDLHGLTRVEAKTELEHFLTRARVNGLRCVLLIHGRGLNSKDNIPVLKESVRAWFERGRGPIGNSVLAFTSARNEDGGLGAMYVLLRRRKPPQ